MDKQTSDNQQHASRASSHPRHISRFLGFVNAPSEVQLTHEEQRFERLWGVLLEHRWAHANNAESSCYEWETWRLWLLLTEFMEGIALASASVGHFYDADALNTLIQVANERRSMAIQRAYAGPDRTGN